MAASEQQIVGEPEPAVVPLRPEGALVALADELRKEGPVIAPHVADPGVAPALGMLVAAGPRCAAAPADYAAVVESVREGYLLHYGDPRLLDALDADLRLLIGDHLYARGIERLVVLGDLLAVRELSDLISLAAQLDASPAPSASAAGAAWLGSALVIAVGPDTAHERAVATLRSTGDARPLWEAAERAAERAGLSAELTATAEAVGFSASDLG
jgi:hypothetical protein